jgi:hypothetical protein
MFLIMTLPLGLTAQTKFEREYRIKEKDVPEKAVQFIDDVFKKAKVKWYSEESQDGKSIEAKTKYQMQKFSVEFDTAGNLQDVEKIIKFEDLGQSTANALTRSLSAQFGDYKIMKIQIQWTSDDPATIKELIKKGSSEKTFVENFEIVLETREDKTFIAYEVLIDQNGNIVKSLELDLRSMNNMEF